MEIAKINKQTILLSVLSLVLCKFKLYFWPSQLIYYWNNQLISFDAELVSSSLRAATLDAKESSIRDGLNGKVMNKN